MLTNQYCNFVRPCSPPESKTVVKASLSGEEAKKIYLEEIKEANNPILSKRNTRSASRTQKNRKGIEDISKVDLFLSVLNNDVHSLTQILDACPNMINTIDEYGWSLLMIACQANAVDTTRELLKRGVDISIRDKADNSARSLVIKNKNLILADLILSYKTSEPLAPKHAVTENKTFKSQSKQTFQCELCNREFPDKEEHLSSTLHNIHASIDKKIVPSYKIPESNRGYQIMLKVGWDKQSGLGPTGDGKMYPIKTVQKQDRLGLGHDKKRKHEEIKETVKNINKKMLRRESQISRSMEINFRRQFY